MCSLGPRWVQIRPTTAPGEITSRSADRWADPDLQPGPEQLEDGGRFVLRRNADRRPNSHTWRINRVRRIICVYGRNDEDRNECDQSSALEYTSHKPSFASFRPAVREGTLAS